MVYVVEHTRIVMPPELVIQILECLQDDKRALSQCSLVCHAWVSWAYQHRFRTVTIHKPRFGLPNAVHTLLARLRAAPYLKAYIQELVLTANELATAPNRTLFVGDLCSLLMELGALRVLRISHANLTLPSQASALPCTGKKLSVLSLAAITAPPRAFTLSHVLSLFTEIDQLRLDNFANCPLNHVFFRTDALDHGVSSKSCTRQRVKSVAVVNCCTSITTAALWSLQHTVGTSSVRSLSLQILDSGALADLVKFLQTADHLCYLDLNLLRLPLSYDTHALQYGFNVAALSIPATLRTVHLTMMLWTHSAYAENNCILWKCFAALLSAVASLVHDVHLTLHTAELKTMYVAPVTADAALRYISLLDWEFMTAAILHAPLLKSVAIEVINGDSEGERSTWLKKEMLDLLDTKIPEQARTFLRLV